MNIQEHADRTENILGIRAEDIHKWIDGFFDAESFAYFLKSGKSGNFDPYDHRKFRHCNEALQDAYKEFSEKYSKNDIKKVFECHIKDDYNGYIPFREDFANGNFKEKYHEQNNQINKESIFSEEELNEYFKGKAYFQNKKNSNYIFSGFFFRIILPTITAIILFVSSIFFIIIPLFKNNMMERKKEMIKELTNAAASSINYYIEQEKNGFLSPETAQKMAASEIEKMRYGIDRKDYFWITDMHPIMIMHPYRLDLIGKDLSDYKDSEDKSGKKLFVEFVKIVNDHNEGYLEYLWQWMDDQSKTALKLSYVKKIPEWHWIIGTGIYIHDVQDEMTLLTKKLSIISVIISSLLIIILTYILLQSHNMENNRRMAEAGLIEAKDRYRVLVEASNEGYILEVDGKNVFSNHTLQKMLGLNENELVSKYLWEFLPVGNKINDFAINYLKKLYNGKTGSKKFEAQIKTKNNVMLDVIVSTSNIFFSQKNGHVISIRQIKHNKSDSVYSSFKNYEVQTSRSSFSTEKDESLTNLILEIEKSETTGHIIETLNKLPELIHRMTIRGSRPELLKTTIGSVYDASIIKFIKLSINELGDPPTPFAFLSLGSNARHEMTLFSDQDNAIIFNDVNVSEYTKTKKYFLNLGKRVSSKLNQTGYHYCPGGIMASNPQWCLSKSEWEKQFYEWITNPTNESILKINVFFDIYCVYGDKILEDKLKKYIFDTSENNPNFFIHYTNNCLLYKPPLNILGGIKTEKKNGLKTVNIKECIKPIETLVRIYAVKYKIKKPETISRLKILLEKNIFSENTFREIVYVFDYLWNMRFYNQIISHNDLKKINDDLVLNKLTEIEINNFRNVLSKISTFHSKLSYDFLGNA